MGRKLLQLVSAYSATHLLAVLADSATGNCCSFVTPAGRRTRAGGGQSDRELTCIVHGPVVLFRRRKRSRGTVVVVVLEV